MGITTKDIAKLAGVSRGTVDRVLNNRGQVSAEVKAKILKIAKEFNYKKNVLASRLAINTPVKISIVLPHAEKDVFWDAPLRGTAKLKDSVADYGMSLDLHLFDLFDSRSYTEAFKKAMSARPNAILVAPIFLKETVAQIQIAKHNGIPIVCINSELDSGDVLSFIGQDSYQSGVIAGKLFDLTSSGARQIVVITQGHDSKNAMHIKKKVEGLRYYNDTNECDLEIIEVQIENFTDTKLLQEKADFILSEFKEIGGVFFTNSRAYHFLMNTDLHRGLDESTTVVGYDLLDKNVDLLRDGKIDFVLHQKPEMQGYLGIQSLFNHLIHKKEIAKKQYLPIDIVVKENIDSYIEERDRFLEMLV